MAAVLFPVPEKDIFKSMMKSMFLSFLLLPCILKAQDDKESYAIYSQYLRQFRNEKSRADFVIRTSTDNIRKYHSDDVSEMVTGLRGYVKGDFSFEFFFRPKVNDLRKDTLWIPLIDELSKKIKNEFIIKNEFAPDLQCILISDGIYRKYFGNNKYIDKNWNRFHVQYPIPAFLIDLSEIVGDGKRAVFYFGSHCGGLCGSGSLILFYKDGSEWRFLTTISLWNS
ncbi:MAG TPA: hypothetical protein VGI43_12990 [Mucilaginibacter sp.]